jgi:hypothetical protein
MLSSAKRLQAPFKPVAYEFFAREEGPVTIFRTGSGPKPLRYLWFHGAAASTGNEMITRMANAYHEAGLDLEILSMPYEGREAMRAAVELVRESPDKVMIGGHSAGAWPVGELLGRVPHKVAAVATINSSSPRIPGIPAIAFAGENDGGARFLPRGFAWGDRQVHLVDGGIHRTVVLRNGDHSARSRAWEDPNKAKASVNPGTLRMNLEAAKTLKTFLTDIGLVE